MGTRFSTPVQNGPVAYLASYTVGTGSFPGVKRPGVAFTKHSAEVKERVELYLYSPSGPSWPVLGWTLPLPLLIETVQKHELFSIQFWKFFKIILNFFKTVLNLFQDSSELFSRQFWTFTRKFWTFLKTVLNFFQDNSELFFKTVLSLFKIILNFFQDSPEFFQDNSEHFSRQFWTFFKTALKFFQENSELFSRQLWIFSRQFRTFFKIILNFFQDSSQPFFKRVLNFFKTIINLFQDSSDIFQDNSELFSRQFWTFIKTILNFFQDSSELFSRQFWTFFKTVLNFFQEKSELFSRQLWTFFQDNSELLSRQFCFSLTRWWLASLMTLQKLINATLGRGFLRLKLKRTLLPRSTLLHTLHSCFKKSDSSQMHGTFQFIPEHNLISPVPVAARSRRRSSATRLLRLLVRIQPGAWTFIVYECCQVEISATSWSLVQRSPTDCGASWCVI